MKFGTIAAVFGLVFLAGCVPDLVSVSKDGTIALTLTKDGRFDPLDGDGQQLYLTDAKADFLTAIEGMDKCFCPQIAPSGKAIVAQSKDGLVLYERSARRQRVIYTPPKDAGDVSAGFPVWSPDEKRIAFFVGDFGEDVPDCKLYVYDVKRRESEVVARRVCPRATWLPDNKRLFCVSFPSGAYEEGAPPFGDLKRVNVLAHMQTTVAPGQMLAFSKIALFPSGRAILFPSVSWGHMEISRGGLRVPLVLKKQVFSVPAKPVEKSEPVGGQPQKAGEQTEPKVNPDAGTAQPPESVEEVLEEGLITFSEGQPFCPYGCAVSPDGRKIAFLRYFWEDNSGSAPAEKETTSADPAQKKPVAEEAASPQSEHSDPDGIEFCVAKADGTEVVVVARWSGDALFGQVIWLTDARLLCVCLEKIIAVNADGSSPFDLTATIRTKFADQFAPEEKTTEEQPTGEKRQ